MKTKYQPVALSQESKVALYLQVVKDHDIDKEVMEKLNVKSIDEIDAEEYEFYHDALIGEYLQDHIANMVHGWEWAEARQDQDDRLEEYVNVDCTIYERIADFFRRKFNPSPLD